MTTEFRAICAELLVLAEESISYRAQVSEAVKLIDNARAALAQPEPVELTRGEAVAVYTEVMAAHDCQTLGDMAEHFARAVLARCGTSSLAQVRSSLGDHQPLVEDDVDLYLEQ
jgi:glycine betaine/choline ABC-type transport system substrate-binding protein